MTEPLLLGLTTLGVALVLDWCGTPSMSRDWKSPATAVTEDDGRGRLQSRHVPTARCRDRARAGVPDALRSVAGHRRRARRGPMWDGLRWRRGESASAAITRVALVGAYPAAAIPRLRCVQSCGDRRVVCGQRVLRTGEQGAGFTTDGGVGKSDGACRC